MYDQDATIRSLELGEGIRRQLENINASGHDTATHLGWTPSKLSRILTGKRPASDHDIAKLLGYCGVRHPLADYLLHLATDRHRTDPLTLPADTRTLIDYHELSIESTSYHRDTVPAELCAPYRPTHRGEEHRTYYLAETALQHLDDPAAHLHEILRHSVRPRLSVRVLRTALHIEPFALLRFYDLHPVVRVDTSTLHIYLEDPGDIARYQHHIAELDTTALDEHRSRALITSLAAGHTDHPFPDVALRDDTTTAP